MFELPIFPASDLQVACDLGAAVWPLPIIDGRRPVVVESTRHREGVELAYPRNHPRDGIVACPPGQCRGTEMHFMPTSTPAFAVAGGTIAYAGKQADGYGVLVDHENGWATYCTNLEHMFVIPTQMRLPRAQRVRAGDPLGHIGGAPSWLHFELWRLEDDSHYTRVDPRPHMARWIVLPWTDGRFAPTLEIV